MKYPPVALIFLAAYAGASAETRISVPSDPRASYYALEVTGSENKRVITNRRIGPSGTSYAQRLCDCATGTFK